MGESGEDTEGQAALTISPLEDLARVARFGEGDREG